MAKFKSEVEILLKARDEARAEIEKVRKEMGKLRNESKQVDGLIGGAKLFLNAEKLKGAIGAAGLAMAALKGDTEAMESVARRLPFGFGEVVGMTIDIHRQLSGAADETERMAKQAERTARAGDDALATFAKLERLRAARKGQASVIGLDVKDAQRAIKDQENRVREIGRRETELRELAAKTSTQVTSANRAGVTTTQVRRGLTDDESSELAALRKERGQLQKDIGFGREVVKELQADQAQAQADAAQTAKDKQIAEQRAADDALAAEARAADEKIAVQAKAARELAGMQAQIRANDLKAQGKHAEAERVLIKARFKTQIDEARKANDGLKVIALGKLKDQSLAAVKADTPDTAAAPEFRRRQVSLGSQFGELTGVRERFNQDGQTKTMIKTQQDTLKAQQQTLKATEQLVALIQQGGRVIGFPATASGA